MQWLWYQMWGLRGSWVFDKHFRLSKSSRIRGVEIKSQVQFRCCLVLLRFELEASTEVKTGKISSSWQKQHRSQQIQCWCEKFPVECESLVAESWNSFIRDFFMIPFLHGCKLDLFLSHCLFKIAIWSRAGSVSFTASSVMCEGVGGRSIVKFGGPEL